MKKKLLALVMAALMVAAFSSSAFAAVDEDVDGKGYIGPDTNTNPNTMIDITFPSDFEWEVTPNSLPNVTASKHSIVNNSAKVELSVTLKEFKQTSSESIPELKLSLTDDLLETANGKNIGVDIINGLTTTYTNADAYTATMAPSATWEYSFSGTYNSLTLPGVALQPTYQMTLEFDVVSILP